MNKKVVHEYVYKMLKTTVGNLKLVGSERGLAAVLWENENPKRVRLNIGAEDKKHPFLLEAETQLKEYFNKKRKTFDLKFDFNGTDFQKKVWKVLLGVSFGNTASYAQIAKKIGKPKASRAVGGAIGKNPLCIVVGCHRVIGSSGKLTGYAGGVEAKAALLKLENF